MVLAGCFVDNHQGADLDGGEQRVDGPFCEEGAVTADVVAEPTHDGVKELKDKVEDDEDGWCHAGAGFCSGQATLKVGCYSRYGGNLSKQTTKPD